MFLPNFTFMSCTNYVFCIISSLSCVANKTIPSNYAEYIISTGYKYKNLEDKLIDNNNITFTLSKIDKNNLPTKKFIYS